jgi:hypothetical protein
MVVAMGSHDDLGYVWHLAVSQFKDETMPLLVPSTGPSVGGERPPGNMTFPRELKNGVLWPFLRPEDVTTVMLRDRKFLSPKIDLVEMLSEEAGWQKDAKTAKDALVGIGLELAAPHLETMGKDVSTPAAREESLNNLVNELGRRLGEEVLNVLAREGPKDNSLSKGVAFWLVAEANRAKEIGLPPSAGPRLMPDDPNRTMRLMWGWLLDAMPAWSAKYPEVQSAERELKGLMSPVN